MGAVGHAVGVVVFTLCDRSHRADGRGQISLWVANSLATQEERSSKLAYNSWFSLRISDSWVLTVSSCVVIATIPKTVAPRMERREPSPVVMVWSP